MNKDAAQIRRMIIRDVVLSSGYEISRSVDDWFSYVANHWPKGYGDYPGKSTVKRQLHDMCERNELKFFLHERGWFRQERFKIYRKV